jgi:hypothetical protein
MLLIVLEHTVRIVSLPLRQALDTYKLPPVKDPYLKNRCQTLLKEIDYLHFICSNGHELSM